MQISEISAENFLSFGVGDDAFVLDLNTRAESEPSAVTVLTGANGSGKTNVIRVLQQILDALRNPSDLLSDLRFSYHRTQVGSDEKPVTLDLAHKPSKLTMVCHFDEDEQTLLSDWWRMACGSGENLDRLDSESAQSAAPLPEPFAQYGEWVLQNIGKEPLPIFKEIRIEVIANDPDRTLYGQQSSQILGWLSDDVVLDFRDNRLLRSTEIDNYQQSRDSLSRTMALCSQTTNALLLPTILVRQMPPSSNCRRPISEASPAISSAPTQALTMAA